MPTEPTSTVPDAPHDFDHVGYFYYGIWDGPIEEAFFHWSVVMEVEVTAIDALELETRDEPVATLTPTGRAATDVRDPWQQVIDRFKWSTIRRPVALRAVRYYRNRCGAHPSGLVTHLMVRPPPIPIPDGPVVVDADDFSLGDRFLVLTDCIVSPLSDPARISRLERDPTAGTPPFFQVWLGRRHRILDGRVTLNGHPDMPVGEARDLLVRLGTLGPADPLLTPGPTDAPKSTALTVTFTPSPSPTPDLDPWPGPELPWPYPIRTGAEAIDIATMHVDPEIHVTGSVARLMTQEVRARVISEGMRSHGDDKVPVWVVGLRSDNLSAEAIVRSTGPPLLSDDDAAWFLDDLRAQIAVLDGLYLVLDANGGLVVEKSLLGITAGGPDPLVTFAQIESLPDMDLVIAPSTPPPMAPTVDPALDDDDGFRPTP